MDIQDFQYVTRLPTDFLREIRTKFDHILYLTKNVILDTHFAIAFSKIYFPDIRIFCSISKLKLCKFNNISYHFGENELKDRSEVLQRIG